MAKKPNYKGILTEPMEIDGDPEDYWKRVVALAEHYEVDLPDKGGGFRLALALAQDHVPGFKFKKAKLPFGKTGTAARDLALVVEIIRRINKGLSAKRAAEIVVRARPDLGFNSAGAARVRFAQLTSPTAPDRGNARANLLLLLDYTPTQAT